MEITKKLIGEKFEKSRIIHNIDFSYKDKTNFRRIMHMDTVIFTKNKILVFNYKLGENYTEDQLIKSGHDLFQKKKVITILFKEMVNPILGISRKIEFFTLVNSNIHNKFWSVDNLLSIQNIDQLSKEDCLVYKIFNYVNEYNRDIFKLYIYMKNLSEKSEIKESASEKKPKRKSSLKTYLKKTIEESLTEVMLKEIGKEKPKNIEELKKIKGIGPKKIETFGEKIIEYYKL